MADALSFFTRLRGLRVIDDKLSKVLRGL